VVENPSAFPLAIHPDGACTQPQYGMDLRDYFAAAALPAFLHYLAGDPKTPATKIHIASATAAYMAADAMLAEREKGLVR
jgi:hypothetical protein